MDIISVLVQSIQSISVILIIVGMLIAFLWKAAFYLNLALGLLITFIVTYLVHVVGKNAGFTAGIFFVGFICTLIVAAIGAFLCLLEGFVLSSLGFWAFWVAGTPSSIFSSGVIFGSAIASLISTGIAAYLGDKALSLGIFKGRGGEEGPQPKKEPIPVVILPEGSPTGPSEISPGKKITESDTLIKKRILGYVIAYREVKLEALASRFGLTRDQVEDILLDLLAEGKIKGSIDPKTDRFTLET